jgi:hypothetical protein
VSVLEAIRTLRAALDDPDPGLLPGGDCAVLVAEFATAEKSLAAARASTAARAVACGVHGSDGRALSAREWLARQLGVSASQAQAELDTAVLASSMPATQDALRRGELSLAAAREIVRTELVAAGSEAELLATARREPLHVLREDARTRRLERIEPEELRARQRTARTFRHWRDDLGMFRFDASLLPEDGVALLNRIEAESDRLWRADDGRRGEPREQLLADAFVHVVNTGGKGKNRQADVVVVVDHRKLREGDLAEGPCHVIGGGPVPVSAVRDIAQDAFVKVVLHNGVDVQKVAHVGRYQPAELRTALLLGPAPDFQGVVCSVEGCGRQHGIEFDHVDPIANGGLTTLANYEPKCRGDHRVKTERDREAGLLGRRRREEPP